MTFFDWLNDNPGWFFLYLIIILSCIEEIIEIMRKK